MKKKAHSKKGNYEKRKYLFNCKSCSKSPRDKTKFVIKKFTRSRGVVLQCSQCGLLISRKLKFLDLQMEDEKTLKEFQKVGEENFGSKGIK